MSKRASTAKATKSSKKQKEQSTELEEPMQNIHKSFRAVGNPWVGAHVSAANGLHNAIINATRINSNSFALFLKNQRTWASTALKPEIISQFKQACSSHHFDCNHILPHGSYLINLGNADEEKRQKSLDSFIDDLQRCEQLDISLYNFHPGSTVGECTPSQSIANIAKCINIAHEKTQKVIVVLENMAGQGNVIGSKFEELAEIISLVQDKSRVGVCLDTCHLFAAGYDIRTPAAFESVLKSFDDIIGLPFLKGVHLNDSKGKLGDCKDRHENIGKGFIGLECFRFIMNDSRFHNIPMVLETPVGDDEVETYDREIKLLYSLIERK